MALEPKDNPDLEWQKLQWEKEKFEKTINQESNKWIKDQEFQFKKLAKEQEFDSYKINKENGFNFKNIATGLTIIVSILALGVGWLMQIDEQKTTTDNDRFLQNLTAKYEFQLKAAEIVMDSDSEIETYNKARALKKLFGDALPKDFAENFNLAPRIGKPDKDKLFEVLTEHPENRKQILDDWVILWPGDKSLIDNLTSNEV